MTLSSYFESELLEVHGTGSWLEATSHLTRRRALYTREAGSELTIRLRSTPTEFRLLLLAHDWSGICTVEAAGSLARIDLYCDDAAGRILEVSIPGAGTDTVVRLGSTEERHARAAESQVWLLGFKCDGQFVPIERGQVVSRHVRLVDGTCGKFLVLRSDIGVAESLAEHRIWAPRDVDLFREHVRPGNCVLDIGANFGHHAVLFSRLVGPGGRVLAFEPQKEMFQLLCANASINDCPNLRAWPIALGDEQAMVRMYPIDYAHPTNFGSLGINTSRDEGLAGRGELVPMDRLDHFVSGLPDRPASVDFIKIDVQSFELFVLRGATATLARHAPKIFLEVSPYWMERSGYDYREIYRLLDDFDYRVVRSSHPDGDTDAIPAWDGITDLEWDILAVPDR